VRELFHEELFGGMKSDKYLREAGKASRKLEKALLEDDPVEAFRQAQHQYIMSAMAKEAKAVEKEKAAFAKQVKRFRDREVSGVPQEYTNWVHDILTRVGYTVHRTSEDLRNEIAANPDHSLSDFLDTKTSSGLEIYVPDFLVDPTFKQDINKLTVLQARQVMKAVKSMAKVGREENQIIYKGEKMDLKDFLDSAVDKLSELGLATRFDLSSTTHIGGAWTTFRKGLRVSLASTLQIESLLNRWDNGNIFGLFSYRIGRPMFEAASAEAKLDKEISKLIGNLPGQLSKSELRAYVPNTIFKDPISAYEADGTFNWDKADVRSITKRNLRAILLNAGNADNMGRLAKGHGLEPQQIMDWLFQNTTKEDWDWAQAHGDIFKNLKDKSDDMYRRLSGVAPEAVELSPIQTPFGVYPGWYHPIIHDPLIVGSNVKKVEGGPTFAKEYVRAGTSAGYTKERTNYIAPLSLDLDAIPSRLYQEIHDISFREAVVNASKVLYHPRFLNAVTKHYGKEYSDLFIPWLQDVANSANVMSANQGAMLIASEFMRQNLIGALIGFNPRTVEKHGPTALINSMFQVGGVEFLKAVRSLWTTDPTTGKRMWDWAMETFEELPRRERHYQETVRGAQVTSLEGESLRTKQLRYGTWLVSKSDLLSAVPTAIAAYNNAKMEGRTEGDAIYAANAAVRFAHGSTAVTNRPEIMRGTVVGTWMTSLYSFYNHIANLMYKTGWRAQEAIGAASKGEAEEALEHSKIAVAGVFSAVIFPALIGYLVSGGSEKQDKDESFEKQVAKAGLKAVAEPWPIVRDLVNGLVDGDPSLGLLTTEAKFLTEPFRDLANKKMNAGKTIKHVNNFISITTGLSNAEIGNLAEYLYDLETGKARPKNLKDWWRGLSKGEATKPKDNRPDLIERGLRLIEGGR
jgi:hypothetical protein